MKKRFGNRQSRSLALMFFLLLTGFVIVGLYIGRNRYLESVAPQRISLSKVGGILIAEDGTEHTLQATFTIEAQNWYEKSSDRRALREKVREIVAGLDYASVVGYDGMKYIREELARQLVDFVDPNDITAIYISEIIGDVALEPETPDADRRDETFKGIFQNAQ